MNFSKWHNKLKYIWLFVLLILTSTIAYWYQHGTIKIQNNIYSLLPSQIFTSEIDQSSKEIMNKINSRLFIMLKSTDKKLLEESTRFLESQISETDWVSIVPFPDFQQGYQRIFQYRSNLLSQQDQAFLKEKNFKALIDDSLLRLYSPGLAISSDLLKQDPFLLFSSFLFEQLQYQSTDKKIRIINRYPTIMGSNNWYRLFLLKIHGNSMNIAFQKKVLPVFNAMSEAVFNRYHSQILMTGFLLFSTSGTQAAKNEISIISWGSMIGLIILILMGFRSILPVITELIAILSGLLLAFVVTHIIFHEVHLMTLVFGASLIGISIDFSFYYLFTRTKHQAGGSLDLLIQLMPSLLISLITTLLAYLCLYFTGLIGLQQIAIFSTLGLIGAWLSNFFLLPQLPVLNTGLAQKIFKFLPQLRVYCLQHRYFRICFLSIVTILSLVGIFNLHFDDNVRDLQVKNPELVKEQEEIQTWFGQQEQGQYFIVKGSDENSIAMHEYALLQELKKFQQQKIISQMNAIGLWVPPRQIQLQNSQLIKSISDSVLAQYAQYSGLELALLQRWKQKIGTQGILMFDDVKKSLMLEDLKLSNGERVVLVNSDKDSKLQKLADRLDQVFYVNSTYYLSELFKNYRIKAEVQLMIAILVLLLLTMIIYGPKTGVGLMLPVISAVLASYVTLGVMNYPLNLFSIMPAFLILGIGVDYVIYFYSNQLKDNLTTIPLLFCMLTSIIGFGLLSLSSTYAVQSFGMLIFFGVLYSYVFSFIVIVPKSESYS